MEISKFAGLPAHPLFVHIPVVLLPLVALGTIAIVASARMRDRIGWLVLALGIVAGISTQLAIGSGQALQESVRKSAALDHHVAIAESIRPLALVLFLAGLAVMLIDRRARPAWPFREHEPRSAPPWMTGALAGITVVIAVASCVRLYQIGESGAKATWQNTHIVTSQDDDAAGAGVRGP